MKKGRLSNMSAQGGIITMEFLELMKGESVKNPSVKPQAFATFNLPAPENQKKLDANISNSFYNLVERWDSISNFYEDMDISDARGKWIIPLLRELGFDLGFNREDIVVDGDEHLKFRLSHHGWISPEAPMVHTVAPRQDLEAKTIGGKKTNRSPHDEMQTFLNISKGHKWGVVTNGISFRILRDFFHTTTKGYVEFDVENIMRERSYSDFRAFYRMAHASRFRGNGDNGDCPLELFYKQSVTAGVNVGQNLRSNVKKAIEVLGNGFLTPELTHQMIDNEKFCGVYYSQLLRVIYRLLFLLYAEQRAMLPTRESLYIDEYSITYLRETAETYNGKDDHCDLWEGLKVTFRMLAQGCESLRVFPYNGSLFDDSNIPTIRDHTITNYNLLEAIRCLTLVEEEHVLKRINYLDLDVEEIGSIYESLLDYTPGVLSSAIEINGTTIPGNRFFLDPRGSARKTTGSYYTDKRLVDELIKSALKPVAQKKMKECADKEAAILSLKVCDPACGSGAFLIAATKYLGKELAKIRNDQSEPPDEDIRRARRDVLQHCIYGVDLNPMVVELAKVSLWIDAAVSDLPLNFLDHHIKCGNSLIGTTAELIDKGIPDGAFSPVEGDDKEFAKEIKNKNKIEKEHQLLGEFERVKEPTWAEELEKLSDIEENDSDSVKWKQECYNAIIDSPRRRHEKLIADAWCAAFFWQLDENAPSPPTEAMLRIMQKDIEGGLDARTESMIHELADEYRFFHWHLEFPDVFEGKEKGFDCVLGNPPWEVLMAMRQEFFNKYDQKFRSYDKKKADEISKKILLNAKIQQEWDDYCLTYKKIDSFARNSGYFPNIEWDLNTYKLFTEKFYDIIRNDGYFAIIIPSGIYTDKGCKKLRHLFFNKTIIKKLFCFENKKKIFPIHSSFKFVIFAVKKGGITEKIDCAFMIHDLEDLQILQDKSLSISKDLINKLSPDNFSIMELKSQMDVNILNKCYRFPTLGTKLKGTWNFSLNTREFNMTLERPLFNEKGIGNILYEGKMILQFDINGDNPRYWVEKGVGRKDRLRKEIKMIEADTLKKVLEHVKVKNTEIYQLYHDKIDTDENISQNNIALHYEDYRIVLRSIASNTNERSLISTIIPKNSFIGNSLFCVIPRYLDLDCVLKKNNNIKDCFKYYCSLSQLNYLCSVLNSFIVDYIIRRKITTNLNSFYLYELPVPRVDNNEKKWYFDQIVPRATRLICTTDAFADLWKKVYCLEWNCLSVKDGGTSILEDWNKLTPIWKKECGTYGWDDTKHDIECRAQLRCEIDALIALLYELNKEELEFLLSSFPIVKKKTPWLIEGTLREFDRLKQYTSMNITFNDFSGLKVEMEM